MTDRKPGEPIIIGAITAQEAGGIVSLYEKTDGGHEVVFPLTDAHALAAAITTLAAEAGHPAPVAGVAVKPLDLSHVLKHAFMAGRKSAGGASSFNDEGWTDYDPTPNPAFARIRSALAPAPQDAVALVDRLANAAQAVAERTFNATTARDIELRAALRAITQPQEAKE